MTPVDCYTCGVKVPGESDTFPFCSDACNQVWIDENYKSTRLSNSSRFKEFLKNPKIMTQIKS